MIGLGRMGANMVRRLLAAGHDCIALRHAIPVRRAPRKIRCELTLNRRTHHERVAR
jgi:6-phosphogluconate dehydrogenase (decarboxylating)